MNNVIKVKLSEIDNFKDHPFSVRNDDSIKELMQSIKENGLMNPLIVRQKENGRYEMISGHRRKLAMELLGIKEADCYLKDYSDDEATICMVDSNIAREKILPSEKAFAYKMKMDAMKHQGKTCATILHKTKSRDELGKQTGESGETVRKYIRLTYLIKQLLDIVDESFLNKNAHLTMGITPAVEISYLSETEQKLVYETILYEDATPSYAQAIKIRELSKKKKMSFNALEEIFAEIKGNQNEKISFNKNNIEKALPSELLKRDKRYIEEYIIEAINAYKKIKDKEKEVDINFDKLK